MSKKKENRFHGGHSCYSYKPADDSRQFLDFSANTSPLGLPPRVKEALFAFLDEKEISQYPDPKSRLLSQAIAKKEGLDFKHIVCGNGANDLIFRLVQLVKPAKALILEPAFSEYRYALEQTSKQAYVCKIYSHILRPKNDFTLTNKDLSTIERILRKGCSMFFACSPSNPAGTHIRPDFFLKLAALCEKLKIIFVFDACFSDFLEYKDEKAESLLKSLTSYPRLVKLNAFTKTYGMAGLRLAYAVCGSANLAKNLQNTGQFWPISSLAQKAGIAALEDDGYIEAFRAVIRLERPKLISALEKFGYTVYGKNSSVNYLLFCDKKIKNAIGLQEGLDKKLLSYGICIRSCADYAGLNQLWYRIAIKTPEENTAFTSALALINKEGTYE